VAAGGVVASPRNDRVPRGAEARRHRAAAIERIAAASATDRVTAVVDLAGGEIDEEEVRAVAGWGVRALPDAVVAIRGNVLAAAHLGRLRSAVAGLDAGSHDRATVTRRLVDAGAGSGVASAVIDHLVEEGALVRTSGGFALPEHVDAASRQRRERAEALIARLDAEPFAPPDVDEVARELGLDHREIAMLVQSGEIVRSGKVTFSRGAVERAVAVLAELGAGGRAFTASEAKQAWGTSRRFAIPLLEHLDRTGVTRFDGQHRQLR
jgi:selenocysteine-specific elongation factor